MSVYFACRQQLIVNFQISMYFQAFVSLSILSSSGIFVVLPAPLNCCSFILHSVFIYKGLVFMLKNGHFPRAKEGVVKKLPAASSPDPHSSI